MSFNLSSGTLDTLAGIHAPGKKRRPGGKGGSGAGAKSYDVSGFWAAWMAIDVMDRREAAYGPGSDQHQSNQAVKVLDRTAKSAPEVMVKITGKQSGGAAHVLANFTYQARIGHGKDKELELHTNEGEVLTNAKKMRELAQEWQAHHDDDDIRRKGATSISMVLSMPPGTDAELVLEAGLAFARDEFENHRWVAALHTDTGHPHVHLTIARKGDDGERLNPNRDDTFRYRRLFAEKLNELGVEANATPCRARGVEPKHERIQVVKLREKGVELEIDKRRAEQVREIISGAREDVSLAIAQADREYVQDVYQRSIDELTASDDPENIAIAASLAKFVEAMPAAVTDLSRLVEAARQHEKQSIEKDANHARPGQERDIGTGSNHRAGARDQLRKSYALALAERPMAETYNGLRNLPGGGLAHAAGRYSELLQGASRHSLLQGGEAGTDRLRWSRNGYGSAGGELTPDNSLQLGVKGRMMAEDQLADAPKDGVSSTPPSRQDDEQADQPNRIESNLDAGEKSNIPGELAARYRVVIVGEEENAHVALFRGWGKEPLIEIGNGQISTNSENPQVIRDLVVITTHNGWSELAVAGSAQFKQALWLEATANGFEVKGYEPTFADRQGAAARRLELERADRSPTQKEQPPEPRSHDQAVPKMESPIQDAEASAAAVVPEPASQDIKAMSGASAQETDVPKIDTPERADPETNGELVEREATTPAIDERVSLQVQSQPAVDITSAEQAAPSAERPAPTIDPPQTEVVAEPPLQSDHAPIAEPDAGVQAPEIEQHDVAPRQAQFTPAEIEQPSFGSDTPASSEPGASEGIPTPVQKAAPRAEVTAPAIDPPQTEVVAAEQPLQVNQVPIAEPDAGVQAPEIEVVGAPPPEAPIASAEIELSEQSPAQVEVATEQDLSNDIPTPVVPASPSVEAPAPAIDVPLTEPAAEQPLQPDQAPLAEPSIEENAPDFGPREPAPQDIEVKIEARTQEADAPSIDTLDESEPDTGAELAEREIASLTIEEPVASHEQTDPVVAISSAENITPSIEAHSPAINTPRTEVVSETSLQVDHKPIAEPNGGVQAPHIEQRDIAPPGAQITPAEIEQDRSNDIPMPAEQETTVEANKPARELNDAERWLAEQNTPAAPPNTDAAQRWLEQQYPPTPRDPEQRPSRRDSTDDFDLSR